MNKTLHKLKRIYDLLGRNPGGLRVSEIKYHIEKTTRGGGDIRPHLQILQYMELIDVRRLTGSTDIKIYYKK